MKTLSWLIALLVTFVICPFAYGYNRYGDYGNWHHMMPWGGSWGEGGGFIMGLLGLIIVVVLVYFVFRNVHCASYHSQVERTTALDILKKRYARGEITKAEFDQMKHDLEE